MSQHDKNFLLIGLKGLVLRDIIGIVDEAFPDVKAVNVDTPSDAIPVISQAVSVPFAFLNLSPDAFMDSELSTLLSRKGTRVIFMGGAAEEVADGTQFDVLRRPFGNNDVLTILKSAS